jgi:hypothetical protein
MARTYDELMAEYEFPISMGVVPATWNPDAVTSRIIPLQKTEGVIWMRGWRCPSCGHAIDPLKEVNHLMVESLAT